MRRSLHISPPPSGMAAIRQIPLKKIKIKISDCNRKYYKILHALTEAKNNHTIQANPQNATRD